MDTSETPMMHTGPTVQREPASSSTGNLYITEPQAETEEHMPTQTFDMSTPPVAPRNVHDRTVETTEEPEVEDMDVDGTEEATSSTTVQNTQRIGESPRGSKQGRQEPRNICKNIKKRLSNKTIAEYKICIL